MALDIVFGWHLDGFTYPETSTGKDFSLGSLVVGPAGLAQQLALRLGVTKPFLPQAVRIANYMRALEQIDDGDQFYSKSFALDSWSTASCLLVMREQLISAGWDGNPVTQASRKLLSFSAVEQVVFPLGSPSETLRAIL
ncbi:MAG: hypothetical protein IT342_26700 [Candidatus Melainabacteria bacterium]|nr:hypothetical protein [Candidatus Melainabacteria bacterium]